MSDVSCISSSVIRQEIPESAVPEDLCHSKAPTPNDSLEPPVARQHNAGASHQSPSLPRSTMGRARGLSAPVWPARVTPRAGPGAPPQTCHSPPAIEPRVNL